MLTVGVLLEKLQLLKVHRVEDQAERMVGTQQEHQTERLGKGNEMVDQKGKPWGPNSASKVAD